MDRGRVVAVTIAVLFFHVITLGVVFTLASGWDNACDILWKQQGYDQTISLDAAGSRGTTFNHYVDPGYTCEYYYKVDSEPVTLTLETSLEIARAVVFVMTGLYVFVGYRFLKRPPKVPDPLTIVGQTAQD